MHISLLLIFEHLHKPWEVPPQNAPDTSADGGGPVALATSPGASGAGGKKTAGWNPLKGVPNAGRMEVVETFDPRNNAGEKNPGFVRDLEALGGVCDGRFYKFYSLSNRRLALYRLCEQIGLLDFVEVEVVRYRPFHERDAVPFHRKKITTTTNGVSIFVRKENLHVTDSVLDLHRQAAIKPYDRKSLVHKLLNLEGRIGKMNVESLLAIDDEVRRNGECGGEW